jgi:predicted acylesterase/phospholipase RssA
LAEADLDPDSIAGISIGAINAALIAGNEPEARVDRLRAFRERITGKPYCDWSERLFSGKSDAVLHLIYRAKDCEGHSKDYRFSSASMQERWRAGYYDAIRTLRHPKCSSAPPITRAPSPSTSPTTAANRKGFSMLPACLSERSPNRRGAAVERQRLKRGSR